MAGLLTEACVSFMVLSALAAGIEVFVVADACGGLTELGHDLALRRMEGEGALMTSWMRVLLELQRDWTRREPYEGARALGEPRRRLWHRPGLCARNDKAGLSAPDRLRVTTPPRQRAAARYSLSTLGWGVPGLALVSDGRRGAECLAELKLGRSKIACFARSCEPN